MTKSRCSGSVIAALSVGGVPPEARTARAPLPPEQTLPEARTGWRRCVPGIGGDTGWG